MWELFQSILGLVAAGKKDIGVVYICNFFCSSETDNQGRWRDGILRFSQPSNLLSFIVLFIRSFLVFAERGKRLQLAGPEICTMERDEGLCLLMQKKKHSTSVVYVIILSYIKRCLPPLGTHINWDEVSLSLPHRSKLWVGCLSLHLIRNVSLFWDQNITLMKMY
jgi:hypothetical protein